MTALLAGATGLIGREVAAAWGGPGAIHLLLRSAQVPAHALQGVLVVDFRTLPALPPADEAICCLGTTLGAAGSRAAFQMVDLEAVLAFAHAARASGVTRFGVVSALGADAHSHNFYSRIKGEMEQGLTTLSFKSLVIARPSLLIGNRAVLGQPMRWGEKFALVATAPLRPFMPRAWRPIHAASVARALLRAVREGRPGVRVLDSGELHMLGKR